MLRLNGYSTAAFGKYHETAPWEVSVSGPFDRWPTRSGFDKFYGFIGGEANQWAPLIYDGTSKVEPPEDPDYHFTTDMTNQAITWMRYQAVAHPGQAVLHLLRDRRHARALTTCPKEWIAKYKGSSTTAGTSTASDAGPADRAGRRAPRHQAGGQAERTSRTGTRCPPMRNETLRPPDGSLRRLCRAHGPRGRPALDAIEDMGEMDNTLFIYVFGDNGSSAEGGLTGTFNETTALNGLPDPGRGSAQTPG